VVLASKVSIPGERFRRDALALGDTGGVTQGAARAAQLAPAEALRAT